jgi:hypothetical protein
MIAFNSLFLSNTVYGFISSLSSLFLVSRFFLLSIVLADSVIVVNGIDIIYVDSFCCWSNFPKLWPVILSKFKSGFYCIKTDKSVLLLSNKIPIIFLLELILA